MVSSVIPKRKYQRAYVRVASVRSVVFNVRWLYVCVPGPSSLKAGMFTSPAHLPRQSTRSALHPSEPTANHAS